MNPSHQDIALTSARSSISTFTTRLVHYVSLVTTFRLTRRRCSPPPTGQDPPIRPRLSLPLPSQRPLTMILAMTSSWRQRSRAAQEHETIPAARAGSERDDAARVTSECGGRSRRGPADPRITGACSRRSCVSRTVVVFCLGVRLMLHVGAASASGTPAGHGRSVDSALSAHARGGHDQADHADDAGCLQAAPHELGRVAAAGWSALPDSHTASSPCG